MSRIGKKEIAIPEKVEVKVEATDKGQLVSVKGPLGSLRKEFSAETKVVVEANQVKVTRANETKSARALHGLNRTLIANMVKGVTDGFRKELEIVGVGYRAHLKGTNLDFQLGKSHPIIFPAPEGIKFAVEDNNTRIIIDGYDKEMVGQVAANIMSLRPPEPYKGKGIKLKGQKIKRKAGKSGSKS